MARKVIISCALTGGSDNYKRSSYVPITPEQIATQAIDAASAGAAVVHIHVRDPKTGAPSMKFEYYEEVVDRIRSSNVDVVINLTSGPGARYDPASFRKDAETAVSALDPRVRVEHILRLKPEICSLDVATLNMGNTAFVNTPPDLAEMANLIADAGVKPELEVFDLGHIHLAKHLLSQGVLKSPPFFQLCMGVPWGAEATASAMLAMRDALPSDAIWSTFGISRYNFKFAALATILDGHVRVGLEDNLYIEPGVLAPDNRSLVEKAITIVRLLDGEIASASEAREILGFGNC